MPNVTKAKGAPTAAPPPSLTELQRRLLADPFRLEGESGVRWEPPSVLPDRERVKRVVAELDRGLLPTRPEFLKWICDKLSALPTQTATGMNAALWADNVIDVCAHYPEDLLQSATLELLRTKTFRPTPAEIVEVIDSKFLERQRMLERARMLLGNDALKAAAAFVPDPEDVRLRTVRDSFKRIGRLDLATPAEIKLAKLENREVEAWATVAKTAHKPTAALQDEIAEILSRPMTEDQRRVSEARRDNMRRTLTEDTHEPIGNEAA